MSHEITEYDHYVEGESIVWPFQIKEGGSAKDLSSASVNYHVLEGPADSNSNAVLSDSDANVTVDIEPGSPTHPNAPADTTGYIEVRIDRGALSDRGGDRLWQRLVIDDSGTGRRKFRGAWEPQME